MTLGPDPDDLLDQGYTDQNGEFMLQGNTVELTPIDPILKVYHDCDDGLKVHDDSLVYICLIKNLGFRKFQDQISVGVS